MARNLLWLWGVCLFAISCGSTQNASNSKRTKTVVDEAIIVQPEVVDSTKVIHSQGLNFFKRNIADITKNNNTISYGSIVSANPKGYKVTMDYFPSLGQNFRQRYIILHYTALDDAKSIATLTQQAVSAHYLVSDFNDKDIWQLVDENKRAYHAGVSSWNTDTDLNNSSIGIEIVNQGFTMDSLGQRQFADYPSYQISKVAALVKNIADRYNIPPERILGHSDIAPTRKQDPGPRFPWKLLYTKYQLGMWYDDDVKNTFLSQYEAMDFTQQNADPAFVGEEQTALKKFGYGINVTGQYDWQTQSVVLAFQYHFRPEKADGKMDAETYAILQALLQKYVK